MAQGPSDTILVAIWITLRIRESKVRNPDPPYYSLIVSCRVRRRFVLSERILVSFTSRTFVDVRLSNDILYTRHRFGPGRNVDLLISLM